MIIHISHPVSCDTLIYPNTPLLEIRSHRSIADGDSANTSFISLSNHTGTHIDMPLHFCKERESVKDMLRDFNVFTPAYCIDIPKAPADAVSQQDILPYVTDIHNAEALLIRTGTYASRKTAGYISDYPRVKKEVPGFLRQNFPNLKLFGIDTLSVSSPNHREEGRECHRGFLCHDRSILILEDVDLSSGYLTPKPMDLVICPWFVEKIDATPVTAFLIAPG